METFKQKEHLEYPELTMFQMIEKAALDNPDGAAYEFYDRKTTYKSFVQKIERAARAFTAMGIGMGDAVTICMPNTPQGLIAFYALDRIGAIANMVHPLSAQSEIAFYLNLSRSRMLLTVDMFCEKVEAALHSVDHPVTLIVTRMQDELSPIKGIAYTAMTGRSYLKYPNSDHSMKWKTFLAKGDGRVTLPEVTYDTKRTSVILYSGGTSGTPKGICLSDLNFNACALQCTEAVGFTFQKTDKMLSCMPIFHGFGLGVNIHTILINGACCVLMPSFNGKSYAKMLVKKRPNYIAGVPTIFEALLHMEELKDADLSCLRGMFCGGDSLSVELKKKVDAFLHEHGADIQVREGYGLTECVTASCLTPRDTYKEHSIGIPFPDTIYKIRKPGTSEECRPFEEGEITLTGPSLMLGYLRNPDETASTLRVLEDGKTWLFTGDLGYMDEENYVYYRQRIKRLIVTNGYNVYPGQVENIIDSHPDVSYSCVIGVKDTRRMHRVKAYIVLKDGIAPTEECKSQIMDYLKLHVAKYALPREIEFRKELPKTLVGKVAYRKLEEEADAAEDARLAAEEQAKEEEAKA